MRLEAIRLVLGIAALAIVVIGAVKVLLPFVQPILWAAILGSATWPAYRRLRELLGNRESLAAALMTVALVVTVVVPVVFLGIALVREIEPAVSRAQTWAASGQAELPDWAKKIPGVEAAAKPWLDRLTDEEQRERWLKDGLWPMERVIRWSRGVLTQIAVLLLTVFTLFFVYRDGENAAREARWLLDRIAGGGGKSLLLAVRATVRAVFFGWLLTAAAQGLVSMFGYWAVGLHAPVLLGVATGLAAVIPFGVGLVWIPAALSLVMSGEVGKAIFLAAWSIGVVSFIDNFLRPLFISGPSKIPFILVFFGVMGGLLVFGFIGLVLGPVFLGILLALWRQLRDNLDRAAELEATGTV